MTDEEWLQVLEKKIQVLKFFTSPVHAYGRGKGRMHIATVKCLLLVVIWQFFLCGFIFSCSWQHCIQISQIRVWSAQNDATSDNWVLPIIKCPPVYAPAISWRGHKNTENDQCVMKIIGVQVCSDQNQNANPEHPGIEACWISYLKKYFLQVIWVRSFEQFHLKWNYK